MSDKNYTRNRIVRPLIQYKRDMLVSCENLLKDEDRPIWTALPRLGNALGRSQLRLKEAVEKKPMGKAIAPLIESSVATQAIALNLVVGARSQVLKAGARLARRCVNAADDALEKVKEK